MRLRLLFYLYLIQTVLKTVCWCRLISIPGHSNSEVWIQATGLHFLCSWRCFPFHPEGLEFQAYKLWSLLSIVSHLPGYACVHQSVNGGGLIFHPSNIWNAGLNFLPRWFHKHSHLVYVNEKIGLNFNHYHLWFPFIVFWLLYCFVFHYDCAALRLHCISAVVVIITVPHQLHLHCDPAVDHSDGTADMLQSVKTHFWFKHIHSTMWKVLWFYKIWLIVTE